MRELRNTIDSNFDIEEVRTICFDLSIDYDSLRGEGKTAKVRELVLQCARQRRLPELFDLLKKERSHIEWESIQPKVPFEAITNTKGALPQVELLKNTFEKPRSLLGNSVGAYNLMEFLGAGGSGLVFRTKHAALGREAAIKIFYPLDPEYSAFYDRFRQGFRAIGALDHPHIVKILDFNELRVSGFKTCFLVMEYIQGVDLRTWSRRLEGDANIIKRRLQIAIQIAKALMAAHETSYIDSTGFEVRGVLHGDLKPENILVTSNGVVKLLDFLLVDIHRLMDPRVIPEYASALLDIRGVHVPLTGAYGTPGFMAPEQIREGIVTHKTDVFGLGATYEHLFGFKPGQKNDLTILFNEQMKNLPKDRPTIQDVVNRLQKIYSALVLYNDW